MDLLKLTVKYTVICETKIYRITEMRFALFMLPLICFASATAQCKKQKSYELSIDLWNQIIFVKLSLLCQIGNYVLYHLHLPTCFYYLGLSDLFAFPVFWVIIWGEKKNMSKKYLSWTFPEHTLKPCNFLIAAFPPQGEVHDESRAWLMISKELSI